jgi:hypothetical protein
MSVIAGVIVVASSLLFTLVVFPDYFRELEAMQRQMLAAAGRTAEEIEDAVRATGATQTSTIYAMQGFIGTVVTGILASAIAAIWIRGDRRR